LWLLKLNSLLFFSPKK